MDTTRNTFKYILEEKDKFIISCEQIPGQLPRGKRIDNILAFAEKCKETGLVHALSLLDNPGGTPTLCPDVLAHEIETVGIPAIVHFSAKDMNRNMIMSRSLALDRMGVHNLLIMSGDYQSVGQAGLSMPVFDIDPVHILTTLNLMNKDYRDDCEKLILEECPHTDFFCGATVSPYKYTEAGLMLQLYKMEKKIRAGARYFITQLGFDTAKLSDLKTYVREHGITVPIIGSVFILRKGAANAMNRKEIPGAFVTDTLLKTILTEEEADDRGRAASLERAAMQVAVLKGLGYRGAHIEAMVLTFDMVETILGRAETLTPQWEECAEKLNYAPKGGFYLGKTGAAAHSPVSRKLKSGWATYRIMRVLHILFFSKDKPLSGTMRVLTHILDSVKPLGIVSHIFERIFKKLIFNCSDCGDCALPELEFLCPQSQCPKQLRIGPCGGSHLDACEVYPDRPCVWNRVYVRAKAFGEQDMIRKTIYGPCDWKLQNTSAWVNFHQNYDHTGYDYEEFLDKPESGKQ